MDINIYQDGKLFSCRSACLFTHKNTILLTKNPKADFWTIPGGRIQIGESTKNAIKREIQEERGHPLTNPKFICFAENFFNWNGKDWHELYFIYHQEVNSTETAQKLTLKTEGSEAIWQWFSTEEIRDLELEPAFLKDTILTPPKDVIHISN